ncbi:aromatic prenyltransferase [Auricularia subglabra TFB-10046 SS5]|nr:aromatic prenyltransferase [Auricularia subglabra TFB-10046 SS5]
MTLSSIVSAEPRTLPVLSRLLPWRKNLANALSRVYTILKAGPSHVEAPCSSDDEDADDSQADDERFWIAALGPMLDAMLREGNYPADRREELADFLAQYVAPYFGPEPSRDPTTGRLVPAWKSFMTDDFTPLEPSWTWKGGKAQPLVKFSAEAIPLDSSAGAGVRSALRMMDALAAAQGSHVHFDRDALLQVMDHLTSLVEPAALPSHGAPGSTALSQVMLGFDLHHGATHTKAYLIPTLRALETGRSKLDVITDAVRTCGAGACWEHVLSYLSSQPDADPFLLAIDCAPFEKARFKAYIRFPSTDVNRLLEHASLGGRIPLSPKFVKAVRALWDRLSADSDDAGLYRVASQTSGGTPMYFSVERHASLPTPKFYVPIRLLGWNDQRIAEVFGDWMAEYGNPEAGRNYVQALQKLSPGRSLASRRGFHTYIGIVPTANGDIEPSVYLNPSIFS